MSLDFVFEYEYSPVPDAADRFAAAWELILALILEDLENEPEPNSEGEQC